MLTFKHDAETQKILGQTLRNNVPAAPDPLTSARSVSRSTTIVGLMLEDLGDKRGGWKKPGGAVTRFGQITWALVELAAPRSLGQILFQYWIAIAYALAFLMIIIGILAGSQAVTRAGYLVFGISLLINIVVEKLRRSMASKRLGALKPVFFVIPLVLFAGAAAFIYLKIADVEMASPLTALNLEWVFMICYTGPALSLGWILATAYTRPYRAFACIIAAILMTVGADAVITFNGYFSGPTYERWTWEQVRFHGAALMVGILALQALTARQQSRFERV